ncbi:hypothetical protein HYU50_05650 [Candidatus Woesearchaeota archaeon]|nr:hypothetical protein [Candidatus Woesearchaeota archaeon]
MSNRIIIVLMAFLLIFIYGCAQTAEKTPVSEKAQEPEEAGAAAETEEKAPSTNGISPEVKQLLDTAGTKVKSVRYSYKGPETADFYYQFYVKGNKIKYLPDPDYKAIDVDEDAYDAIYLDKGLKTALAYCDDRKCRVKGQKAELGYNDAYIMTPLDWLSQIKSAEKTGEELINKRSAWKLSTNAGTVWVDTFFGVPLQAESSGNLYKFDKISFNDVKDEDVTPSQP